MEIRVLKYFLAVAREESITRAAESLHMTQPTLSRQLMQLEEELNTQLFIRRKNRIQLTEEGMLLKSRAEEIIGLVDKTEKDFVNHHDVMVGEIFIGGGETDTMHRVGKVMKQFHDEYPQVKFVMHSGNADDVKDRIDKGLIDIGLLVEPVNIEKYDFIRLPQKDTWGVLMPCDCELSHKDYVTVDDLVDKPILHSHRLTVQNEISHWFGDSYEKLNVVMKYNLINNAAIMVEEGLGLAVTFDKVIRVNSDSKLVFKPLYPPLKTGTVLVWKKHQVFSPASSRFIQKLKETFEGISE